MKGIHLAHGVRAEYFIASGGMGFDGRGWWWDRLMLSTGIMKPIPENVVIILKTLTMKPRVGNLNMWKPWGCVRRLSRDGEDVSFRLWDWRSDDGFVNAVGLTNVGFTEWLDEEHFGLHFRKHKFVISIDPHTPEEAEEMAKELERRWSGHVLGIELNASCPNTEMSPSEKTELVVEMARRIIGKMPLIIKLGVANDVRGILSQLKDESIAVDIMNTVPWAKVYPDRVSPLAHLGGGGVSGPVIIPMRDELYKLVRSEFPQLPVLLSGGIWDRQSFQRTVSMEPDAVGFGTVLLKQPSLIAELVPSAR